MVVDNSEKHGVVCFTLFQPVAHQSVPVNMSTQRTTNFSDAVKHSVQWYYRTGRRTASFGESYVNIAIELGSDTLKLYKGHPISMPTPGTILIGKIAGFGQNTRNNLHRALAEASIYQPGIRNTSIRIRFSLKTHLAVTRGFLLCLFREEIYQFVHARRPRRLPHATNKEGI